MKLLKKLIFTSLIIFVSVLAFAGFSSYANTAHSNAALEKYNFSKFIKFSSSSAFSENNLHQIDNLNYSIVSNNAVSVSLNLFAYKFNFNNDLSDLSNFSITYSDVITLENTTGEITFSFDEIKYKYYYSINSGKLYLYSSSTMYQSTLKHTIVQENLEFGFFLKPRLITDENGSAKTVYDFKYISYITCTLDSPETVLTLNVNDGGNRTYNFKFLKPITKFANQQEPIINFLCKGQDAGSNITGYSPTWLPSERTYQSVTIKFFKNYTEENPLFFNINFNGFVYYYQIYIKNNLLVFKYIDQDNSSEKLYNIFNNQLSKTSSFDIEFNKIGRYEIELYDLTYDTALTKEENIKNFANYYSTSFYIYDSSKTFENIYVVSQSYENNQPIDYLVSNNSQTATVNNDIRVTFKNLYNLSSDNFKKVKIEIIKTLFTGSINSQTTIYDYTNSFMNECFENKSDFYINFTEDARYKINVYYDNNPTAIISCSYEVVKLPKTIFQVGNEGDPYYDKYVETKPYTKTEKIYNVPLTSQISLNISYFDINNDKTIENQENSTFEKIYINQFKIFFGIAEVKVYRYTRMVKEGGEDKPASTLDIKIDAVGKINVTISKDGNIISRQSFSEFENRVLTFSEFGEYSIHVVDEMGTTASASFSYQKGMNTSAIALIVLSSVLVLAIVIFVLRSRSKIATR